MSNRLIKAVGAALKSQAITKIELKNLNAIERRIRTEIACPNVGGCGVIAHHTAIAFKKFEPLFIVRNDEKMSRSSLDGYPHIMLQLHDTLYWDSDGLLCAKTVDVQGCKTHLIVDNSGNTAVPGGEDLSGRSYYEWVGTNDTYDAQFFGQRYTLQDLESVLLEQKRWSGWFDRKTSVPVLRSILEEQIGKVISFSVNGIKDAELENVEIGARGF